MRSILLCPGRHFRQLCSLISNTKPRFSLNIIHMELMAHINKHDPQNMELKTLRKGLVQKMPARRSTVRLRALLHQVPPMTSSTSTAT